MDPEILCGFLPLMNHTYHGVHFIHKIYYVDPGREVKQNLVIMCNLFCSCHMFVNDLVQ